MAPQSDLIQFFLGFSVIFGSFWAIIPGFINNYLIVVSCNSVLDMCHNITSTDTDTDRPNIRAPSHAFMLLTITLKSAS